MKNAQGGQGGTCMNFCFKCINCCLDCFERFVRYLNSKAFIQVLKFLILKKKLICSLDRNHRWKFLHISLWKLLSCHEECRPFRCPWYSRINCFILRKNFYCCFNWLNLLLNAHKNRTFPDGNLFPYCSNDSILLK